MLSLKIFSPGKKVIFKGQTYTVSYVTLSNMDLYVNFVELDYSGHHVRALSTEVECDVTELKHRDIEFKDRYIRRYRN
jgi:hypothetical protein